MGTTADKLQHLINGKQTVVNSVNNKANTSHTIDSKWNDIAASIDNISTGTSATVSVKSDGGLPIVPGELVYEVYPNLNATEADIIEAANNYMNTAEGYAKQGWYVAYNPSTDTSIGLMGGQMDDTTVIVFLADMNTGMPIVVLYSNTDFPDMGIVGSGWNTSALNEKGCFEFPTDGFEPDDYLPFTQEALNCLTGIFSANGPFPSTEKKLEGDYDGSDIYVTENKTVDMGAMLDEHKLPLNINVNVLAGASAIVSIPAEGTPITPSEKILKIYPNLNATESDIITSYYKYGEQCQGYPSNMYFSANADMSVGYSMLMLAEEGGPILIAIVDMNTEMPISILYCSIVEPALGVTETGWQIQNLTEDGYFVFPDQEGMEVMADYMQPQAAYNELTNIFSINNKPIGDAKVLEGDYDGSEITITENQKVNMVEYLDSKKLPLSINVDVPIPEGYIKPSGTLGIKKNGTFTVTSYEKVNIMVPTTYPEMIAALIKSRSATKYTGDASYLFYRFKDDVSQYINDETFSNCEYMTYLFNEAAPTVKIPNLTFGAATINGDSMFEDYKGDVNYLPDEIIFSGLMSVINIPGMFYQNSPSNNITKVPTIRVTSSTFGLNLRYFCYNCVITELPTVPYTAVQILEYAFYNTKITKFPDTKFNALTTARNMCERCSLLTEVGALTFAKDANLNSAFLDCIALETVKSIDMINIVTQGYAINMFTYCRNLKNVNLFNIKIPITLGVGTGSSGTDYGYLLTQESLIQIIGELIDTGSSKTLTIGSANLSKLANVYVKITSTNADENGNVKLPFEVCSASDEGAMLITNYVTQKNWTLA